MTEHEPIAINAHGFDIVISAAGDEGTDLHIEATSQTTHIIFESSRDGMLAKKHSVTPLSSPPPLPSTPAVEQVSSPETKMYQAKFNLGANPFPITTTKGPMYLVLAYIRELNGKAIPSEQATAFKIVVLENELDLIMDKAQASETNPKGLVLHKGDFVQAPLVRRNFVQISGKPGKTREMPIRGYAFSEAPVILSPKQKPLPKSQ